MRATIDRFEGDVAVLLTESGEIHVDRRKLAEDAREGDVVDVDTGEVDRDATERLRSEVQKARERARRRSGPGGSFDL
ncbi:MAG: DUF3006 domain-containing protein [Myxococcaceae bacterium]